MGVIRCVSCLFLNTDNTMKNMNWWFVGHDLCWMRSWDIVMLQVWEISKWLLSIIHSICDSIFLIYWNFGAAPAFCKRQIKANILRTNAMAKTDEIILCLMGYTSEWCQTRIEKPFPLPPPIARRSRRFIHSPNTTITQLGLGICRKVWKGDEAHTLYYSIGK